MKLFIVLFQICLAGYFGFTLGGQIPFVLAVPIGIIVGVIAGAIAGLACEAFEDVGYY